MRADFGRNAFDAAGGVKAGAGAFMGATAVADVAAFAFFLVAVQKFADFFARFFVESCENVPLQIWGVVIRCDESGARENVPVRCDSNGAVIHMARVEPVP